MKKITNITLYLYIIGVFFSPYYSGKRTLYLTLFFGMLFSFWVLFSIWKEKRTVRFNYFLILYFIFLIVCTFSYFYAIDKGYVLAILTNIFPLFIVCFGLYNYLKSWEDIRYFLKCYITVAVISCVISLLFYDFTEITRETLMGGPNSAAIRLSFAIFYIILLFFLEQKMIILLSLPIILSVILLTMSVKTIIFLVIFFSCTFFVYILKRVSFKKKSKRKLFLIVSLLFIILIIFASQIEFFNLSFWRVDAKIQKYIIEKEFGLRGELIEDGLFLFKQRPLLGFGINNFREYYGSKTGLYTYTHNNFLELLVGVGLLGFFIYYSIYIISFYLLIKKYFKTKQDIYLLFNLVLIGFFFIGFTQQTYWIVSVKLFFTVMTRCLFINKIPGSIETIIKKKSKIYN